MLYNKGQRKCHNLLCYPICRCSNVGIWKAKPLGKPILGKTPLPPNNNMEEFKKKLMNFKPSLPQYYKNGDFLVKNK